MRFIVRVDDCGWFPPEKRPDAGLEYFSRWYHSAELDKRHVPCVFGFIPTTMTVREIGLLNALFSQGPNGDARDQHEVAIHGWDHERGATVTAEQMIQAYRGMVRPSLPFTANGWQHRPNYIPPFNASSVETVKALSQCCNAVDQGYGYFFGGFPGDEQSVQYGSEPIVVERRVIHLPASKHWYDRAATLVERVRELPEGELKVNPPQTFDEPPTVLTLHATWDDSSLDAVRELFDLIAGCSFGPDFARNYLRYQGRCNLGK